MNYAKCAWPWFGGKRHAAPLIWERFGDSEHFVDPFCGSLAVLLCRPALANRGYHSETVNDADGYVVNAWRAIRSAPDEVAEWASWPPSEADLMARHLWLIRWAREGDPAPILRLRADPDWCDARAAGYWIWGQSCWIGSGWCSGRGSWTVDLERGCVVRRPRAGGVAGQRLHLGNNGQRACSQTLREPGVAGQLPRIGNNGQNACSPALREPGVVCECAAEINWHPMAMPKLREWIRYLSARLRHVRILAGDWSRLVTGGASRTLGVRQGGACGVLLDPPYGAAAGRDMGLYSVDSGTVASDVRAWCLAHGNDPAYRIALCGFSGEGHEELVAHGWTEEEWFTEGFLRGGLGNLSGSGGHQMERDRIWFSPHCLRPEPSRQIGMWEET